MKKLRAVLPVAVQLAGGGSTAAGVYLLAGLAWALLAVGVVLVALGVFAEIRGA